MRRIWKIGLIVALGLGLAGCAWLFPPLTAVLTATPPSGPAPLSVTFSAAGSTGPIESFTLDFESNGTVDYTGTDITIPVNHTYNTAGTYTATLAVQDAHGRTATATKTITVTAPLATSVSLGAFPASGPAPLGVEFWANITAAPGRRIKHVALDYDGDGTPEEQADVDFENYNFLIGMYEYTDPGMYTATLTVTDDASPAQTFTATATIIVTSPPPEITEFKANDVSFDAEDPTLTIASGTTVTFSFEAKAAAGTERKIVKWTLDTPGSNVSFQTMDVAPIASLNVTDLVREYTNDTEQTKSYTATLTVFDDINKSDTATITIKVQPAASP